MMKWLCVMIGAFLLLFWFGAGFGQATAGDGDKYVSKEEYDKLKQEMEQMKAEMAELKQQQQAGRGSDLEAALGDLEKQIKTVKDEAEITRPGSTKFLLTGYGFAGFNSPRNGNSTFDAGFNPIFLWQLSDRLLFEGELEFELVTPNGTGSSETETSLEYADISYILNDYMTVGGGKFLLPFGIFNERLHPAWINKLPNRPLPFDDDVGIAPEAGIGAFLRGAFPAGSTKFNYAVYVDNGPALFTDDPDEAGRLDFDNYSDNNHNKAVGTRIGFLPIPELEFGYSLQGAKVNPGNFEEVDMFLQALDVSYVREIRPLYGTIDTRAEWVWSDVDDATYDPTGQLGFGPLQFGNDRNGGYFQLAYRPSLASERIIKNLEFVLRYDRLQVPDNSPGSSDESRWTPGIDYWVTPSMVVKVAYQFDETSGAPDQDMLFVQAAMGF
jgi:hypothetical protein